MANIKNLIPFSGADDPRRVSGPKKGTEHSSTRLRRLLELTENLKNPVTGTVEGFTVLEQLDLKQIIKARQGDSRAYEIILDRLEGKPKQTVEGKLSGSIDIDDNKTIETLLKTAEYVLSNVPKKVKDVSTKNPASPKKK